MTRLFCIKEDVNGKPTAARLMRREMRNQLAIDAEITRLVSTGKWTRVVCLCTDSRLLIQAARWAASLLSVNPRYVLDPSVFVGYISGGNWNHPCPSYAHYEDLVKAVGDELWHEFSAYRAVPHDEAIRRMGLLLNAVGLKPVEGV